METAVHVIRGFVNGQKGLLSTRSWLSVDQGQLMVSRQRFLVNRLVRPTLVCDQRRQ